MKILALETSAKAVSAAVTEDGKVLCSGYQDTGLTHSRTLMPIVEGMLKNTGLTVRDCDAVAVAVGPGSFTGIRIGVAAAQGAGLRRGKAGGGGIHPGGHGPECSPHGGPYHRAMDARRNQVYNALFRSHGARRTERLTEDRAISLPDLAEEVRPHGRTQDHSGRRCVPVPECSGRAKHFLRGRPAAPHHAECCLRGPVRGEAALRGGLIDPQALAPVYLRPPQALPLRDRQ